MKNTIKVQLVRVFGIIALAVVIGFSMAACSGDSEPEPEPEPELEPQTPVASDYTIGNSRQTSGSVTAVTITPYSGKSPGTVLNIKYNGNDAIPQTVGTYAVTFDVAEAAGWNAAAGLSAGNLVVTPVTLSSLDEFLDWCQLMITTDAYENTVDTAYTVKLNISDIGGARTANGSLGFCLFSQSPYIILDLSGSTFTSITGGAFSNCSALVGITIPNTVTSIGMHAFAGCTSLESVTFTATSKVTSIGNNAFEGCTSLIGISLPNSVTTIGDSAFKDCTSLSYTNIPNNVTTIEGSTFSGCTSLTSVVIPANVTSIGAAAFSGCTKLTDVTFQGTITSDNFADDAFGSGDGLRDMYLDDTTGGIGRYNVTLIFNGTKYWTKQ